MGIREVELVAFAYNIIDGQEELALAQEVI